ncbi:hypothetical protein LC613_36500 [Nostoc sphaeroides CHAB 2801]|uniref:hypothetical protein n=1 Tax=Nostoc sphaeroides TaxID=446679 RepID=UPI001E5123E8|nr:hypothetical protein [Nostoc sphaeroides]MCC5633028.1 hypothetical protein [Nostoc sphaeroides CHAB 2801]
MDFRQYYGSNASKKDAIASRNNEYYSLRCGNIMVPVAAILWVNRHFLMLSNISPTVSSLYLPQVDVSFAAS